MAYFTDFPDILLPSFTDNRNSSADFVRTKNLFKRAKIRDDIFRDAVAFEEFAIQGDDRPDNVAFKAYGCLLYTSPSPRDRTRSRMPSSA